MKAPKAEMEKLPTEDPVLTRALATVDVANSLVITNQAHADHAQDLIKSVVGMYKAAEDIVAPPAAMAFEHYKKQVAHRDKYLVPLEKAKKSLSAKIGEWLAAVARKAEEQRRAAEEKLRLEQIAIQKAEAEAKAKEAEALAAAGRQEEAANAMEEAVAIEQAPPAPVYVPPAPVAPKAKGISQTTHWDFEIVDPTKIPNAFMVPNEVVIRKHGQMHEGRMPIPGVRFFPKYGVSTRV